MNPYGELSSLINEGKLKGREKKAAQRFATLRQQMADKAREKRGTARLIEVQAELDKQGYKETLDVIDNPQHRDTAQDSIRLHRGEGCVGAACKDVISAHAHDPSFHEKSRGQEKKASYARHRGLDPTPGATREYLTRKKKGLGGGENGDI